MQLVLADPLVKLLFNHIDSDGNGTVEKDEFMAYIHEVSSQQSLQC